MPVVTAQGLEASSDLGQTGAALDRLRGLVDAQQTASAIGAAVCDEPLIPGRLLNSSRGGGGTSATVEDLLRSHADDRPG